MVRLKDYPFCGYLFNFLLFQFQYGAIKRIRGGFADDLHDLFQFQYGAIKSRAVGTLLDIHNTNFNSNMVRLKGCRLVVGDTSFRVFQFQYGAIKRHHPT